MKVKRSVFKARRRLTPKQRVLKKHPRAVCDRNLFGSWRIWVPSKIYRAGFDPISDGFTDRGTAWADAAKKL